MSLKYSRQRTKDCQVIQEFEKYNHKEAADYLRKKGFRNLDGLNPIDNVFRTIITYNIIITQN